MGFFSRLFGGPEHAEKPDRERALAEIYVRLYQDLKGMSRDQAVATVKAQVEEAKAEAAREGTANLPPNYGDILLEEERTDASTGAKLAKARAEGATDEDIRWWWNLCDLERRLMVKDDDLNRMALFMKSLDDGMSPEDAAALVRKRGPTYGDPNDTRHTTGDDRPLPFELKDRVNRYISRRMAEAPEAFQQEIDGSTTFNAVVRRDLRARRL